VPFAFTEGFKNAASEKPAQDLAEQAPNQDFVLASGKIWHARDAVEALFRRYGLDYRNHNSRARCEARCRAQRFAGVPRGCDWSSADGGFFCDRRRLLAEFDR
jgi:hypothetical protein